MHTFKSPSIVLLVYLLLKDYWESLYCKYVVPILSCFTYAWYADVICVAVVLIIVAYCLYNVKKKQIDKSYIVWASLIIVIYLGCYRYDTSLLQKMRTMPVFYYADIIPFLAAYATIACSPLRKIGWQQSADVIPFITDDPILDKKQDILSISTVAQECTNRLLATKVDHQAFTLGIVGKWGEGKTSFMNMMKCHITSINELENKEIIVVDFNPWLYGHGMRLTPQFFDKMIEVLSSKDKALATSIQRYSEKLSKTNISCITNTFGIIARLLRKDICHEDLKEICRSHSQPIVVFVDDIDRLNGNELTEVLQLVRNASNLPYIFFVLAYDKQYVIDTILNLYGDYGLNYTDKIFQEEINLPPIQKKQLSILLSDTLKECIGGNFILDLESIVDTAVANLSTLREVKRYANILSTHLKYLKDDVNIRDYCILQLILLKWPFVFQLIEEKRNNILYNRRGQLCLFNAENTKENDCHILELLHGPMIDIKVYLDTHKKQLHVSDIDKGHIKILLDDLWSSSRIARIPNINHSLYMDRYFQYRLCDDELSEAEFEDFIRKPYNEQQQDIDSLLARQYTHFIAKLRDVRNMESEEKIKNRLSLWMCVNSKTGHLIYGYYEINNLINHLSFDIADKPQAIKDYTKSLLYENSDYRAAILLVNDIGRNFHYASSFTSEEIAQIMCDMFIKQVNKNEDDFYDNWSLYQNMNKAPSPTDLPKVAKFKRKINEQMRDFASRHLYDFMVVSISHETSDETYGLRPDVSYIWGNLDNFVNYMNTVPKETSAIDEYRRFLAAYKNVNFKSPIPFTWNELR